MSPNHRRHWALVLGADSLGMLHMEIIQERLEREFDMTVITTVPNVSYFAYTTKGERSFPFKTLRICQTPQLWIRVEEPFIRAQIITKSDFVGAVMSLCIEKRGILTNQVYLTTDRVELPLKCPWAKSFLIFTIN